MSPEQFRQIADFFPDAALLLGTDGTVVAANRAVDSLGWGAEDLVGRNLRELASDADEVIGELLRLCSRSRETVAGALHLRRPRGEDLSCRCFGARCTSPEETPRLLLRIKPNATDPSQFAVLTEKIDELSEEVRRRRRSESLLRDQRELLRVTLASIGDAVITTDHLGHATYLNPVAEELTGWSSGEAQGRSLREVFRIINENTRQAAEDPVAKVLREGITVGLANHTLLISKQGTERPIDDSAAPIRNVRDEVIGVVLVFRDVTERKQNENDLRFVAEASRSLATLVDYESTLQQIAGLAVPHFADWCSIYLPDETSQLQQLAVARNHSGGEQPGSVEVGREIHKRLSVDPSASSGPYQVFRSGRSLLIPEASEMVLGDSDQDHDHLQALQSLGMKSYMCVPLAVRENTIGVVEFIAAGSRRQYTPADLALAEDLGRRAAIATENARLYATLRDDGRKKDEFLAMLAHELRNPLAPIQSGIDLLGMMGSDRDILDTMQQQMQHLVRLVDDLLDVSRIMRGKVELRRETVELSTILSRAADGLRPLAERHAQRLDVSMPSSPIWIDADPVRMAQVVGNLLNNSHKYTDAGGRISVFTELGDEHVSIHVCDTGKGISSQLLPHVFDLFTQDQRTIDRSQGGLGIGLTVVRSLVEMQGGTVAAHSEGAGRGSEFVVRLPVVSATALPALPSPESTAIPDFRILVVDDNVSAATLLCRLLAKLGDHHVVMAHDGLAAVAAAHAHLPDIILLDIGLPKLDGFEVARQLREHPRFQNAVVVALTGYGTEQDRQKSLKAGFDEHLVKPPSVEMLRNLLANQKFSRP